MLKHKAKDKHAENEKLQQELKVKLNEALGIVNTLKIERENNFANIEKLRVSLEKTEEINKSLLTDSEKKLKDMQGKLSQENNSLSQQNTLLESKCKEVEIQRSKIEQTFGEKIKEIEEKNNKIVDDLHKKVENLQSELKISSELSGKLKEEYANLLSLKKK